MDDVFWNPLVFFFSLHQFSISFVSLQYISFFIHNFIDTLLHTNKRNLFLSCSYTQLTGCLFLFFAFNATWILYNYTKCVFVCFWERVYYIFGFLYRHKIYVFSVYRILMMPLQFLGFFFCFPHKDFCLFILYVFDWICVTDSTWNIVIWQILYSFLFCDINKLW